MIVPKIQPEIKFVDNAAAMLLVNAVIAVVVVIPRKD